MHSKKFGIKFMLMISASFCFKRASTAESAKRASFHDLIKLSMTKTVMVPRVT